MLLQNTAVQSHLMQVFLMKNLRLAPTENFLYFYFEGASKQPLRLNAIIYDSSFPISAKHFFTSVHPLLFIWVYCVGVQNFAFPVGRVWFFHKIIFFSISGFGSSKKKKRNNGIRFIHKSDFRFGCRGSDPRFTGI